MMLELPVSLGGLATLTNVGAAYDGIAATRGLGVALVNFLGVNAIEFTVGCNKVGAGTQSWQLWNETDGAEIGVIDDDGAGGNKILATTINVVPSGTKLVRVRAKSTVAQDDPVYYGSTLLLRRPGITFERLGLAEQITRNIFQLTSNMRDNASGYKAQVAAGGQESVAAVAAVMVADAGQYLIRLGWLTTLGTSNLVLLQQTLADYGATVGGMASVRDSLQAVAEHTQAAPLATVAEVNTEADYILANVPNYLRMW